MKRRTNKRRHFASDSLRASLEQPEMKDGALKLLTARSWALQHNNAKTPLSPTKRAFLGSLRASGHL